MITAKEFPNKTFKSKKELFNALIENKALIIESKKAEIYKSIDKGVSILSNQKSIAKMMETVKSFEIDDDYYYFVVNSSNILDSHGDMHVEGNWEKTVKEQQGRVYLVFDHELKRSEIIAMKNDVEMFTATIPFKAIGKDYEGNTYALIYKVKKSAIVNPQAKEWLEKGYDFEASVRMQYMDIDIAMNSNDNEHKSYKENYVKYYDQIANKNEVGDIDYFFLVKQAKNVMESSLVMFGSNGATGRIQENKEVADYVTTTEIKEEPSDDTQECETKRKLNAILLNI